MARAGDLRQRLASTLNAAYGDGLLSEHTLARRLDTLFSSAVVDPVGLVGDLTLRPPERAGIPETVRRAADGVRRALSAPARLAARPQPSPLLALDWEGGQSELIVGRHLASDIVLSDPTVSRRHARLSFRDGHWIVCDLESTNGTLVNGKPIIRCRLEPGDRVVFGEQPMLVD